MNLFKRLGIWEIFGKAMNSRPGLFLLGVFRRVVERAVSSLAAGKSEGRPALAPFAMELRKARVSLVTTTGVHLEDQEPFDTAAALGDSSFRAIPSDADPARLRIAHTHFPHERAKRDINVIFPIQRLRELAEEGAIGSVGAYHYSFGFDLHVRELTDPSSGTAHEVARRLKEDGVDVVLLTPG